jgi:hypothetical protein
VTTLDRRTTLKWVLAASGAFGLGEITAPRASATGGSGYGTDPNLLPSYRPGELWPLTLGPAERRTTAVLADVIIPADETSPSASAVGVVDFIDEWVSAPYPRQRNDRTVVTAGLAWIEDEARRRFGRGFTELGSEQHRAICDDICDARRAVAPLAEAARFFARFRDLAAGGFYTAPEGVKDLGYVGNVPLASFEGPPPEVLKRAGLA